LLISQHGGLGNLNFTLDEVLAQDIYNNASPSKPSLRFKDRAEAAIRGLAENLNGDTTG
jgi:hypothetical protein